MNPNFAIIGLPGSGKTTFLAALFHIVEAGEKECRLKLDRLDGDLDYLNKITEAWRTYKPVERTSQTGDTDVTMHLSDTRTGTKAAAFFPDIAGERFSDQVEARKSRRDFIENIARCDGVMLFITADSKQDFLSITERNAMMPPEAASEQGIPDEAVANKPATQSAEGTESDTPQWEPKNTPNQVRIVQILTDLIRQPFEVRRRRLAVIVSAWDLHDASPMTPSGWLAGNMALVDQFLHANRDYFDSLIYGVSAQGTGLKNKAKIDRLSKKNPSERILIVDGPDRGHDITAPLLWLMANG